MMRTLRAALVAMAMLAGTLIVTGSPASAYFTESCFGQEGRFKDGTRVLRADWTNDGLVDECFGIAPNRHVYHAWRTSTRWTEMLHGGLADHMCWTTFQASSGWRAVYVKVNGKGVYLSEFLPSGGWQPWEHNPHITGC
jgi:hypothetical protein